MSSSIPDSRGINITAPPWARCLGTLDAQHYPALPDITNAFENALAHPIGVNGSLLRNFHADDTVSIVVSDGSRKTGIDQVLPQMIGWLLEKGLSENALSFLIATGVHRPATPEEQKCILGVNIYKRFQSQIFNHDAHDDANLLPVGVTSRGTVVILNRRACECDYLILTGAATPHYFAGFGGGRKALVPGLAGNGTIAQNHIRSLHPSDPQIDPRVRTFALDGNPVAEDLLEGAQLHPPAFIVNTVLGKDGAIVGLFAGELDAAHRKACALAKDIYSAPITERADLVVAAMDTAPNFIQCHKALFNATLALKPGGRIILLAPASEGLGGEGFRGYLEMRSPEAVAAALRLKPDINGQTALSTLQKAPHTIFVTELCDADVGLTGGEKAVSLHDAFQRAARHFEQHGIAAPTCYLMPNAGCTVPVLAYNAT